MSKRDKHNEGVLIDVERCSGCLNCQLICSIVFEHSFNPSLARIKILGGPGNRDIRFSEDCTGCNLCVEHCVYGTLSEAKEMG